MFEVVSRFHPSGPSPSCPRFYQSAASPARVATYEEEEEEQECFRYPCFMDDSILATVLRGCDMARRIEDNLPQANAAAASGNQQAARRWLLLSCQDVAAMFSAAAKGLMVSTPEISGDTATKPSSVGFSGHHHPVDLLGGSGMASPDHAGMGEAAAGLALAAQRTVGFPSAVGYGASETVAAALEITTAAMGHPGVDSASKAAGKRPLEQPGSSSHQRTSRRRGPSSSANRTIRVPAPPSGSVENPPPDDGHTWRKYGQKDILNSKYPRSYYRCTHKNFYNCDAKKQVQRLDEDPYTYEVTYIGDHTCQTNTTPLLLEHVLSDVTHGTDLTVEPSITIAVPGANMQPPQSSQLPPSNASLSTSIYLGGGWPLVAGVTEGRLVRNNQSQAAGEPSAAELADVMFNSSTGGSSCLDAIFQPKFSK